MTSDSSNSIAHPVTSVSDSPTKLWDSERRFNRLAKNQPPAVGVSLSGGGNRSAAFSIGVLAALREKHILPRVDIVSAVSGGSYALSWLLLQPYYYRKLLNPSAAVRDIQAQMFNLDSGFQKYLENNACLGARSLFVFAMRLAISGVFTLVLFNPLRLLSTSGALRNKNSALRHWYRSGNQKTYQVLPDPATGSASLFKRQGPGLWDGARLAAHHVEFSAVASIPVTFPSMAEFAFEHGLPAFVFQTTVRPPDASDPGSICDRVFEMGAEGFGSDSCGYCRWEATDGLGWEPGDDMKGRSMAEEPSPFATLRSFNIASSISGAAVSAAGIKRRTPRLLLNLTNFGLEYAIPHPSAQDRMVFLSDGGHSENLGALSLIRRRCRSILMVDAEHDPEFKYSGYKELQRAVGELKMKLQIPSIDKNGRPTDAAPIAVGTVTMDGKIVSRIHYLKLAMNPDILGEQATVIMDYKKTNEAFPQESTIDQYFQPAQFKAYRALGYAIGNHDSISGLICPL